MSDLNQLIIDTLASGYHKKPIDISLDSSRVAIMVLWSSYQLYCLNSIRISKPEKSFIVEKLVNIRRVFNFKQGIRVDIYNKLILVSVHFLPMP